MPMGDDAAFLAEITKDFKRLQQQKARANGGVEGRVLLALAFDLGEHEATVSNRQLKLADADENKLHLV